MNVDFIKFCSNKFIAKPSKIHGIGIFANQNFKSDFLLETVIPYKISKLLFFINIAYIKLCIFCKKKNKTNLFKYLGYTGEVFHVLPTMFMYSNHSKDNANIKIIYNKDQNTYSVITIKDINIGDEILLNYKTQNFFYKS